MKEFLRILAEEIMGVLGQHRRGVIVLAMVPIIYTLAYGSLFYNNTVTHLPVGICSLDEGKDGRDLVRQLAETPELSIQAYYDSETEAQDALVRGEISGAVIIPQDFSKKIAANQPVSVELLADNTNTVLGGAILKAVQSAVNTCNGEIAARQAMAAGWSGTEAAQQLQISSRSLYNPTGGYNDFFLIPLMVHALQIGTVFVLGPAMVLERKRRSRELAAQPIRHLLAKALVYVSVETTVMAICYAYAIHAFGLICRASILDILALNAAFAFTMTSFGLFAGSWISTPTKAISYTLFYIMPSILFSGAVWPRSSMDSISLLLSYIMPIGYCADAMRLLFVQGEAPSLWFNIAILLGIGCLFLLLGAKGLAKGAAGEQVKEVKYNEGYYTAGIAHTNP